MFRLKGNFRDCPFGFDDITINFLKIIMNMINKTIREVPEGTEFISNWADYTLPTGHCIVDKGVTGCGYTEMCLRNDLNVILCSPRRLLLENKAEQHDEDINILYLENNIENWEKDKPEFEEQMRRHISKCKAQGLPIKFMVVYDSAKYLIDFLGRQRILQDFYFVADEFQSIFLDSYFKADVENNFIKTLQICPNVIYLSATPMLDKYLAQMDEFKNLPFEVLDWSKTGFVETIRLQSKRTSSLSEEAGKIIKAYLDGDYPMLIKDGGEIALSKEAVMFFNSVTEITRLIKKYKLTPDQCNVICTKSNPDQVKKVEKLGKGWAVGKIPKRGQPNKMFTFCTSSCFIGSDFYSKCASTYIFADPNLECLALDISLDLPQIAGRQRDKDNPFKNLVTIFYRTLRDENINDRAQFDEYQRKRREKTASVLRGFSDINLEEDKAAILEKIEDSIILKKYSKDFVGIDRATGRPVYNKFIEIANERAWEVIQEDYQTDVHVTRSLERNYKIIRTDYKDRDDKIVDEMLGKFFKANLFRDKLRIFCEFMDNYNDNEYIKNKLSYKIPDPRFLNYYNFFGTEGCRACSFQEDVILTRLKDTLLMDTIYSELIKEFKLGDKLSKKEIKERLGIVYKNANIKQTPKATDLSRWFEIKDVSIYPGENKKIHGFEILALKKT